MSEHHYEYGKSLEQILDTVGDATERAHIIEEAYELLCSLPLEACVVDEEDLPWHEGHWYGVS